VRTRFTEEEDRQILQMVDEFGRHEWNAVSRMLGTRTARQCRERWRHYLRPGIASAPWTYQEDTLLYQKFALLGPKWAQISTLFPGRTEVNVKNRWTKLSRDRQNGSGSIEDWIEMPHAIVHDFRQVSADSRPFPSISMMPPREDGSKRLNFLEMVMNSSGV
jgi:hypothetical protein